MIIPVYEAKTLFANIDQVILASIRFVMDLERATPHDVAHICLKHVSLQSSLRSSRMLIPSYHREHLTPIGRTSASRTNRNGCFKRFARNTPLSPATSRSVK